MERGKEKDLTPERSVGVYTHARLYLCSPAMSVFTACVSALGCPLSVILFPPPSALVHLERISMIRALVVQSSASSRHHLPNYLCLTIILGVWAVSFVVSISLTRSEEHLQKPVPSRTETQRS